MKPLDLLILILGILTFIPSSSYAADAGDFSGSVAIGAGYAGVLSGPSNGLIIQGPVGIGTSAVYSGDNLRLYNGSNTGTSSDSAVLGISSINRNAILDIDAATAYVSSISFFGAGALNAQINYWNSSNYLAFYTNQNGVYNSNERMRIDASGNVAIGTTSPEFRLQVAADMTYPGDITNGGSQISLTGMSVPQKRMNLGYDTSSAQVNGFGYIAAGYYGTAWTNLALQPSGGAVGIGTSAPAYTLDVNGKVHVASFASASSTTVCSNGGVLSSCSSDERLKTHVRPLTDGLDEVLQMNPVAFDWKDEKKKEWEKHDFGFIAQDMEKISPLYVTHDENGYMGIREPQLTAVLVNAIKEQQKEIDELRSEVEALTIQLKNHQE